VLAIGLALGCGESASSGDVAPSPGGSAGTGGALSGAGGGGSVAGSASVAGGATQAGSAGNAAAAGSGGGGGSIVTGGSGGSADAGGDAGGSAGSAGTGGAAPNPEGVPADYQLFIDQTFADPASLSELRFANPQDWVHQTADGGYVETTGTSYVPPHASPHTLAIFFEQKFGAFVLDLEVMQTNPSGGHRDFCIAWGMESPSRFYYAHVAEAHDAVSHNIHIVLDADRTAITKTNTPGFDWGSNVWRKLRVTRNAAGDMAVYGEGNATPLLTASDTRLGAGYVGIGSFDDKGRVRNVKLWAPSADKTPAGFFTAK
jgi:hypothetical protein